MHTDLLYFYLAIETGAILDEKGEGEVWNRHEDSKNLLHYQSANSCSLKAFFVGALLL